MARTHARILTTIWTDADFVSLSSIAQWLYVVILSQGDLSYVGVTSVAVRRWASFSSTTTPAEVDTALWELHARGFVIHDETTEEVMVRTYLKHDGPLTNPQLAGKAARDFDHVTSPALREAILVLLPEEQALRLSRARARTHARARACPAPRAAGDAPSPSPSPAPTPTSSSSVVTTQGEACLSGDEEGIRLRTDKALDLLARRDLDAAVARGTTVGARGPYLRRLRVERSQVDGPTIEALAAEHPDWNAGVLAGAVDPVRPTVAEYVPDAERRAEP